MSPALCASPSFPRKRESPTRNLPSLFVRHSRERGNLPRETSQAPYPVIPAKAGIPRARPPKPLCPSFPPPFLVISAHAGISSRDLRGCAVEIPAFAGMTEVRAGVAETGRGGGPIIPAALPLSFPPPPPPPPSFPRKRESPSRNLPSPFVCHSRRTPRHSRARGNLVAIPPRSCGGDSRFRGNDGSEGGNGGGAAAGGCCTVRL